MSKSLFVGLHFLILSSSAIAALDLPAGAVLTGERAEAAQEQGFPSSAFANKDTKFLDAEGDVLHRAYSFEKIGLSASSLARTMRNQLSTDGFEIIFECGQNECGGFDFRYLLDLLPEPQMHVDLGNYTYLLARHKDQRVVSTVTSEAPNKGFVHISTVTPSDAPQTSLVTGTSASDTTAQSPGASFGSPLVDRLQAAGHVPLDDLDFASGSAELTNETAASLSELASFLNGAPDARIALVGHTDAVGSLDGNTALSQKRAEAVRRVLISTFGVSENQLSAKGIGFLAPRASNASKEGRAKNRRVEAVLTSTPVR